MDFHLIISLTRLDSQCVETNLFNLTGTLARPLAGDRTGPARARARHTASALSAHMCIRTGLLLPLHLRAPAVTRTPYRVAAFRPRLCASAIPTWIPPAASSRARANHPIAAQSRTGLGWAARVVARPGPARPSAVRRRNQLAREQLVATSQFGETVSRESPDPTRELVCAQVLICRQISLFRTLCLPADAS